MSLVLLAASVVAGAPAPALDDGSRPPLVDVARYTLRRPPAGWTEPGFDAAGWEEGPGGFGARGTAGARVGTVWTTDDIWVRKTLTLDAVPRNPALLLSHDEDAEFYVNGVQAAAFDGFVTDYFTVPLPPEAAAALKIGENVLAVHCRQREGGQFVDVHLVDAGAVPDLPPPPRLTEPFKTDLLTEWGAAVTPENAWTEYPRPQLRREGWRNLNGSWEYALAPLTAARMPNPDGEILVPFCLESKLGGVQKLLHGDEALWYRRTFEADRPGPADRTLLHFEAVDYVCDAFVDGTHVGRHVGGNLPFQFDITDALTGGGTAGGGEHELVLRVEDETGLYQLRGKQSREPGHIFYTRVSGVWGTVWTETVPLRRIDRLKIATDPDAGTITVAPHLAGPRADGETLKVTVRDGEAVVAEGTGDPTDAGRGVTLAVPDAKLWSPGDPHLYDLTVELSAAGKPVDAVESYAGIRSVGVTAAADGHPRFTLNGRVTFHFGPLDQGWWPDGLLTPPSDEAMIWEIEWLKAAGFNMLRKHIKVEPRRYYYHCDRLGIMVWQDQVSGWPQPPWSKLRPNPTDADWPAVAHAQYLAELKAMIDLLENHPSIVCWVPFNEAWGQHRTVEVGEWTARRDPTRLVNVASGGNWWPAGDVVDAHNYPEPAFPFALDQGRFEGYVKVIGEYGGHGLRVRGHEYDPEARIFSYGDLPEDADELDRRYETSTKTLADLIDRGIAGAVYTQTTDVEGEINGLLTYDRKVEKLPAARLRAVAEEAGLYDPPGDQPR